MVNSFVGDGGRDDHAVSGCDGAMGRGLSFADLYHFSLQLIACTELFHFALLGCGNFVLESPSSPECDRFIAIFFYPIVLRSRPSAFKLLQALKARQRHMGETGNGERNDRRWIRR